jgi:hypothetical protein
MWPVNSYLSYLIIGAVWADAVFVSELQRRVKIFMIGSVAVPVGFCAPGADIPAPCLGTLRHREGWIASGLLDWR